ncbi:MAG: hypothetical protein HY940_04585 [Gammaproteobacteria bacterium]|nr:hypothetical protein [Gammaproteobacteria bacterium]
MTLIELLLGSLLGLLLLATLLNAWLQLAASSQRQLGQLRLEHELRSTVLLMTRDLRRAGYWHWQPGSAASLYDNPFLQPATRPRLARATVSEAADSCITFSYDLDGDGLVNDGSLELFGYRQRSGALETRSSASAAACSSGQWQDITTAGIEITTLQFTLDTVHHAMATSSPCSTGAACVGDMLIGITLAGQLQGQPHTRHTLQEQIHVRNPLLSRL